MNRLRFALLALLACAVSGFTAISLDILDILEAFVKDGTLNIRYRHCTRAWSPTRVHAVVHARRGDVRRVAAAP